MSDIRNELIKLAYENPELREDLVPLLQKKAGIPNMSRSLAHYKDDAMERFAKDAAEGIALAIPGAKATDSSRSYGGLVKGKGGWVLKIIAGTGAQIVLEHSRDRGMEADGEDFRTEKVSLNDMLDAAKSLLEKHGYET